MATTIPAWNQGISQVIHQNLNTMLDAVDARRTSKGKAPMQGPERTLRCLLISAGYESPTDLASAAHIGRQHMMRAARGVGTLSHVQRCAIAVACRTPIHVIDIIFDSARALAGASTDPSESSEP